MQELKRTIPPPYQQSLDAVDLDRIDQPVALLTCQHVEHQKKSWMYLRRRMTEVDWPHTRYNSD
jgi:hypothetical protein